MFFIIMDMTFFIDIRVLNNYFYPSIHSIRNNYYIYSALFASSKFYVWLFYKYIYINFFDGYADRRIENPAKPSFPNKKTPIRKFFLTRKTDRKPQNLQLSIRLFMAFLLIFERSIAQ
jgi:hypothetical protein